MKKLILIALLVFVVGCGGGSPTKQEYQFSLDDPNPANRAAAIKERQARYGSTKR